MHDAVLILAQARSDGGIGMLLVFGLTIAVFYFLMWRPQAKQQAEHRALMATLKKGDDVITTGGIIGKILSVEDKFVVMEFVSGKARVLKSSVHGRLAADGSGPGASAPSTDKKEEK